MPTFVTHATVESEDVTVHLDYMYDDYGVFSSEITKVIYKSVDVFNLLSEDVLYELEAFADHKLDRQDD